MAFIARLTRSGLLDVYQQEYIRTARAKGLGSWTILTRHALGNAILPVITYLGPLAASLLTGSFIVETIFAIPGLGQYFVTSIYNRDYTVILGITIFYSALVVFLNILVDMIYPLIDPRVTTEEGQMNKEDFLPIERTPQEEITSFIKRPSKWARFKVNRLAVVGATIILVMIVLAILGPLISPYTYADQSLIDANQSPSFESLVSAQIHLGRDIYTRVMYGARISLTIGFVAAFINLVIGVTYGGIAGYLAVRLTAS